MAASRPGAAVGDGLAWLFGRALIGALRDLDPDAARALGAAAGRAFWRTGGGRLRDARANLRLAFPRLGAARREALLRASLENLGRSAAEVALMHGRHRERLFASVYVEGEEHLVAARGATPHGGVIALSAHLGSWELCAAALAARGHPLTAVGRARSGRRVEALVRGWREAAGEQVLPLGRAAAGVVRALHAGRAVAMLLDQDARRREGVFAPFFGEPASTRAAPAWVAARGAFPVLPVFFAREADGARHRVRIGPPLEIEPIARGTSREQARAATVRNVARMNEAIERAIRAAPEQWIWVHRRYRTRPDGAAPVYATHRGAMRRLRHAARRASGGRAAGR